MKPFLYEDCHSNADQMYEGIRPLYEQLFTHVRKVLRAKFGSDAVSADGPVPAHLLGELTNALVWLWLRITLFVYIIVKDRGQRRIYEGPSEGYNTIVLKIQSIFFITLKYYFV